jgi:hypothetical protein
MEGDVTEAGVPVTVELLLLGARDGELTYRRLAVPLPRGVEPDALARETLGGRLGPGSVLHSTSWRFERGELVITFAVAPDPDPATGGGLLADTVADTVAQGADGRHPSAEADHAEVAAHACRHLAFLRATDATVAEASRAQPTVWRLISAFTPRVAGELEGEPPDPATAPAYDRPT